MHRLVFILIILCFPFAAIGQVRIYLLPEVNISGKTVTLGDIAKIESPDAKNYCELVVSKDFYKDSIIDKQEVNDFLSGKISNSFIIFGNGVKLIFELPEREIKVQPKEIVIKKGQSVDLIIRKGSIVIEMSGRALKDCCENDDVEIRLKNGRVIKGKASGEGKVAAFL